MNEYRFSDAFPEIDNFKIETQESKYGNANFGDEYRNFEFSDSRQPHEEMRCSNSQCQHGVFRVWEALRGPILERTEVGKVGACCTGREKSGKPCRQFLSLAFAFKYRVKHPTSV